MHGRRPAGGVRGARRSPGRGACPGRAGAALSTPVPSGDLDAIAALPDRLRETDARGCTDAVAWAADAAAQRLARADLDACRRQYLHRDPNDGNDAPIDPNGQAFPVIVFSHGSTNRLRPHAGADRRAGFVVAAPYHVNNAQDDARIDFINQQAGTQFACSDHRPPPCSRSSVPFSMSDRVSDISRIPDALPGWLGDRVDASRVRVLGRSGGTVTALTAAGGSVSWRDVPNCVKPMPGGQDPRC